MPNTITNYQHPQLYKGRRLIIGLILVGSLIGFEIFNFDTTRFALMDLLGGLKFFGVEWASILAFAFCSIDFAGLIRMFTPEQTLKEEPKEVLLLMGAWLLGASMNAVMTWYAVALALAPRSPGITLVTKEDMLWYAPIFVAFLVWLTRILLIGANAVAADRLLHQPQNNLGPPAQRPLRDHRRQQQPVSNGIQTFQEDFFDA